MFFLHYNRIKMLLKYSLPTNMCVYETWMLDYIIIFYLNIFCIRLMYKLGAYTMFIKRDE